MHTKNARQRIASIIIGSLLTAGLAVAPLAAFAQTKGGPAHYYQNEWSRFFSWFGNRANAATTNNSNDNRGNGSYGYSYGNNGYGDRYGNGGNGSSSTTSPGNLPPNISGITAPTVLDIGGAGTWTVNASDPQNGPLTYSVNWGDNGGAIPFLRVFAQQIFTQSATFTHAYANPGTYTVTFIVKDSAGLTSQTSVTVNVVSSNPAPILSNVSATSTRPHQGTVSWTTDIKSSTLVWYSTTAPVNASGTPQIARYDHTTSHTANLTDLKPSTTYYVIVGSSNGMNGPVTESSQISFTTPGPRINSNAPTISSITGSTTVTAGTAGTWTVNASDPRNQSLTYSVNWGDTGAFMSLFAHVTGQQQAFDQTTTFTHVYANPGTYTATFTVKDTSGLTTSSSVTVDVIAASTTPDTTPPVLSGISANPASTTANIDWTTNEPATSQVYYSTTTPIDLISGITPVVSNSSLQTSESLTLSNLATSTTYYYVVTSADASGNVSTSTQSSFLTSSGD